MRRPFTQMKLFFYSEILNREHARLKRLERARIHDLIKAAQEEHRANALLIQLQLCFDRPKPTVNVTLEAQKYYSALLTHALKMTHNREDAEDLVQELYLRVQEREHTYKEQGNLKGWLFRVMQNICRAKYQTGKKMPTDLQEDEDFITGAENNLADGEFIRGDVMAALNKLPLNMSSIGKLYFIDQLKYGQIAKRLNLPLGTVKCRIHMVRKGLKEHLKEYVK